MFMSLLISNAYANTAPPPQGGGMELIFMLAVFGLIFYFMIYRPQAKRVKEQKELMASLGKGDEVLIQGGLIGKITKVADDKDYVAISIAENVEVTIQKASVSAVLPKGTMESL
jgi:preprotein translocase subunit YajC